MQCRYVLTLFATFVSVLYFERVDDADDCILASYAKGSRPHSLVCCDGFFLFSCATRCATCSTDVEGARHTSRYSLVAVSYWRYRALALVALLV